MIDVISFKFTAISYSVHYIFSNHRHWLIYFFFLWLLFILSFPVYSTKKAAQKETIGSNSTKNMQLVCGLSSGLYVELILSSPSFILTK